jgi:hypothetical protein
MLSHIQRWYAPPAFENDEDKTRMARVLNTLLAAMMLFLVLVGSIGIPFVLVRKLYDSIIVLGLFLVLVTAYWLMQCGHVRLASAVLIAGIWIIFTIFLPFAGGMTSIIAVVYIVDTVVAGLLLGVRAALVHAAACSLAGLGMVIFESSGDPLPRIFLVPAAMGWIIITLGLLLTTTVLNLVLNNLNDALALARRQVEERKQAEEDLRESEGSSQAVGAHATGEHPNQPGGGGRRISDQCRSHAHPAGDREPGTQRAGRHAQWGRAPYRPVQNPGPGDSVCVDCGPTTGGDWIQVTVADTGTGIPPDVLPHIFELSSLPAHR